MFYLLWMMEKTVGTRKKLEKEGQFNWTWGSLRGPWGVS